MSAPDRKDPTRRIRAPRGSTLACKSWLTEAAYRMLQNNLDAEVAENPQELVVYGGIGRAARDWACYDAHPGDPAHARRRPDPADPVRQAGRRVPLASRCAARAAGQFQPGAALGDLGTLQRARSQGPDDVRPDDRGQLDLHRLAGHRPGNLRNLRRDGPPALRRRPRRQVDPDRRPGRHGRRAAAGGDARRRLLAQHRMPAVEHRHAPAHPLRRRAGAATSTTRSRASRRYTAEGKAISIALLGNAAEILPELVRRGVRPDAVTDQTSAHDPLHGYLPAGWTRGGMAASSSSRIRRRWSTRRRIRCACTSRRCSHSRSRACRPSTTATTSARWRTTSAAHDAFDFPGFVPAYVRPLFCRGVGPFRWVAL